jgi:PAS domain S-box-containing protein
MSDTTDSARRLFETTARQSFLDATPIALVIADPHLPDLPIVYVNAAFTVLTGYDATDAVGRNCRFLQGPETDRASVERIRTGMAAEESFTVVLANYRADGSRFWNELSIAPLYDLQGLLAYFIGIQMPYRERARDEHDLRMRELQHRVKNHLQLIVSLIRMHERQAPRDAGAQYSHLARRVQVLEALYSQLSDVAATDNEDERIDLAAFVSQVTGTVAHLLPSRGITVEQHAEPMEARVDLALPLGLMTSELVTNAIQHAFPGDRTGRISVRLSRLDDDRAQLSVEDDGVGLPTQAGWPEGGQMGGRLVSGLVEQAKAELTIERPARGTRFTIAFSNPATA